MNDCQQPKKDRTLWSKLSDPGFKLLCLFYVTVLSLVLIAILHLLASFVAWIFMLIVSITSVGK
jgi:hypothetical protein